MSVQNTDEMGAKLLQQVALIEAAAADDKKFARAIAQAQTFCKISDCVIRVAKHGRDMEKAGANGGLGAKKA